MESAKVVSEQECPTGHGVIILSGEYPGLEDQHTLARRKDEDLPHASRLAALLGDG